MVDSSVGVVAVAVAVKDHDNDNVRDHVHVHDYRLVASAMATKGRFGGFGWASAVDEYGLFQGTWAPPAEAGGSKLGPGDLKVRPRRTNWERG